MNGIEMTTETRFWMNFAHFFFILLYLLLMSFRNKFKSRDKYYGDVRHSGKIYSFMIISLVIFYMLFIFDRILHEYEIIKETQSLVFFPLNNVTYFATAVLFISIILILFSNKDNANIEIHLLLKIISLLYVYSIYSVIMREIAFGPLFYRMRLDDWNRPKPLILTGFTIFDYIMPLIIMFVCFNITVGRKLYVPMNKSMIEVAAKRF